MQAKPRKIIVVCHNYEPANTPVKPDTENRYFTYGFGGALGKNLKKYLAEYDTEVWRLDGYTKGYNEGVVNDVKFKVFPSFHLSKVFDFSLRFKRELAKEIKENDPIIICLHTHYWLTYSILYFFRNAKIVTTHHGDWSPFFRFSKTKGIRKLKARLDMAIERRFFRYIDHIFTIDLNQIPYFKMAYPGIKYSLWSNGVNIENMKIISRDDARKELGWQSDKKYILYTGKLYKYKQADDLIRTWLQIKKERPGTELVVIGNTPGDPWEEFHGMAEEAGAMLLGRVLNVDLYKYYAAADVYVLFALRDDYFGGPGIATLESLACNTPVVSYAMRNYYGDNPEELGEAPDTVEKHKEAILRILDNPGKYRNIRASIEKYYSYSAVYGRMKPVFEELFSRNKK
jgi:glycosyltransferase involved in cell wall biosynthesis